MPKLTNLLNITPRTVNASVTPLAMPSNFTAQQLSDPSLLVFLEVIATAADRLNPAVTFGVDLSKSQDGVHWTPIGGMTFVGSPDLDPTEKIGCGLGAGSLIGWRVRGLLNLPNPPLTLGATINVGTPAELGF